MRKEWVFLVLIAIVVTVYAPVRHYDFINYDDPDYVSATPNVGAGLAWSGVLWAFTTRDQKIPGFVLLHSNLKSAFANRQSVTEISNLLSDYRFSKIAKQIADLCYKSAVGGCRFQI